jgi:hypothetical protein
MNVLVATPVSTGEDETAPDPMNVLVATPVSTGEEETTPDPMNVLVAAPDPTKVLVTAEMIVWDPPMGELDRVAVTGKTMVLVIGPSYTTVEVIGPV